MTNKISKSLLLLVTITGGLFLFNTGSQAQADSSFANVSYVQANRKIKTNLYRTINGKKSSYYLPKGAKFSVAGVSSTRNAKGTVDYFVSPSLDNYSYRYRSAFTNFKKTNGHITTSEIPFTSKNFTKVNMPYKFSNQYFQYGKAWSFSIKQFHQIFNVTQDGYIQFYSTASLKKEQRSKLL
ncbi:hypothetical protein [Secundilactobacillus oryzae]|uniref:hypothetical protein n=1 Tax=Secundilactobacillus oryzae TaxID=1202668 RepID=UPI0006D0DD91|nr:hypothetical protein [Secundilactobacillus oryzae]